MSSGTGSVTIWAVMALSVSVVQLMSSSAVAV